MAEDEVMQKTTNDKLNQNVRAKCYLHHDEEIRLFCSKCEDVVCFRCLLENHQQHPVRDIKDVFDQIMEKVSRWSSEKESTFSKLEQRKQNIEHKLNENREEESVLQSNLQNCAASWKVKIDEEVEKLSNELKNAFNEKENCLNDLINEVSSSEKYLSDFDPESKANVLNLYCSLKRCLSDEFVSNSRKLMQPSLQLNQETSISLGSVDPGNNIKGTGIKESEELDQTFSGKNNKSYPFRISTKDLFYGRVTKIVPVNDDKAWIIYGRYLYHFEHSEIIKSSYVHNVDDVVVLENGDLFVLNKESTFINQVNKHGVVTPFTCTDPYFPICMDYVEKNSTLMVWMSEKETRHMTLFGMNGAKKSSIGLPASHKGDCFMSALSCNDFSIVFNVEQTTGLRNYIYSYIKDSRSYKSFGGTFGCNPYLQFVCEGMCYDDDGGIIVSDKQFKTVYKLDKNLQFVKTLLNKDVGLVSPSALALKNGLLWLADYDNVTIYKYSDFA